jgi:CubicO group peptidase (beta-lactamase class C family)
MKHTLLKPSLVALACTVFGPLFFAHSLQAGDLAPILQPILVKSKLPSIAAAVVIGDKIESTGATGVRKLGEPTPVTVNDKYHLGSCTKTMTAALTAMLVKEGLLTWQTTIGEVLKGGVHKEFKDVSIEQLLAHVGGFGEECPPEIWAQAYADQGKLSPTKQRQKFVKALLDRKPDYAPGTKSVYSNQGYAVAGVMLETLAKKPWEDLMREKIFKPLGMTSAGFRAPKPDQPWGHNDGTPVAPEPHGDNPDAIGPAATVHASIGDWAKFARYCLQNKDEKLHSTLKHSGNHGVGGWLVQDMPALGGHCLQMIGSNTMWMAVMWVLPGENMAIVVTTNSGAANTFETCDKVVVKLLQEFAK